MPSKPRIGMKADDLLKMRGRGKDNRHKDGRLVAREGGRLVVEWSYKDCTVELRFRRGAYRVAAVRWIT